MKIKNLLLGCALFLAAESFGAPIAVEIVRANADPLSVSLEAELKQRINHSTDFVVNRGAKNALELVIAEPLKTKKVANNTQVSYKVNFLTQHNILSVSSGYCWREQLSECAEQILRDAKLSLRTNEF